MKRVASLAAGLGLAAALLTPVSGLAAGTATRVTVRIEGLNRTLVAPVVIPARAQTIDKDGNPADTCTGDTAAVALERATHGNWTGSYSKGGLGYAVIAIKGESYPFTGSYYWSFWINGKAASTGICGTTLHAGDSLLFFPQCSASTAAGCAQGLFNPPVLKLRVPKSAVKGHSVAIGVTSLANANSAASPAQGATVLVGGKSHTVPASGQVRVTFAKAGTFTVKATQTGSIRDEATVKVSP